MGESGNKRKNDQKELLQLLNENLDGKEIIIAISYENPSKAKAKTGKR